MILFSHMKHLAKENSRVNIQKQKIFELVINVLPMFIPSSVLRWTNISMVIKRENIYMIISFPIVIDKNSFANNSTFFSQMDLTNGNDIRVEKG